MQLILASASPRRKELLGLFRVPFTVRAADIDETMDPAKPPYEEVARVSRLKALAVNRQEDDVVIAADTIVVCRAISDEFGRGITQIEARGYYSGQRKCAIYFVVNRFQLTKLKTIIHEIDPYAFITVTEISDVLGTSSKTK